LEALNAVLNLIYDIEVLLIRNFPAQTDQPSMQKAIDVRKFESGLIDPDWHVRQAWIKFAGTQITNGKLTFFFLVSQESKLLNQPPGLTCPDY
jgi:hypothetical protein